MSTPAENLTPERPMSPDELIDYVGRQYQVPAGLRHGLFKQESGENPNVGSSSTGALGLGQLMPGTARQLGVNPKDPVENVVGSMHYLRGLYDQAKPNSVDDSEAWAKAVAGYFSGPGNMGRAPGQVFRADKSDGATKTSQYVNGVLSKWADYKGSDRDWESAPQGAVNQTPPRPPQPTQVEAPPDASPQISSPAAPVNRSATQPSQPRRAGTQSPAPPPDDVVRTDAIPRAATDAEDAQRFAAANPLKARLPTAQAPSLEATNALGYGLKDFAGDVQNNFGYNTGAPAVPQKRDVSPPSDHPDVALAPITFRVPVSGAGRTPDVDNYTASLYAAQSLGPQAVAAVQNYKRETGRDLFQLGGFDPANGRYVRGEDGKPYYEYTVTPSRASVGVVNAYASGGLEGAQAYGQQAEDARQNYRTQQAKAESDYQNQIADYQKAMQNRGVLGSAVDTAVGAEKDAALGYANFLNNLTTLGDAIYVGETKGYDSPEYEALGVSEEDTRRAIQTARQAEAMEAENQGGVARVLRGIGSGTLQLPQYLALGPHGAGAVAFLDSLGNSDLQGALREGAKMNALGAVGGLAGAAESPVARQLIARGAGAGLMAGSAAMEGERDPRKLAETAAIGAGMTGPGGEGEEAAPRREGLATLGEQSPALQAMAERMRAQEGESVQRASHPEAAIPDAELGDRIAQAHATHDRLEGEAFKHYDRNAPQQSAEFEQASATSHQSLMQAQRLEAERYFRGGGVPDPSAGIFEDDGRFFAKHYPDIARHYGFDEAGRPLADYARASESAQPSQAEPEAAPTPEVASQAQSAQEAAQPEPVHHSQLQPRSEDGTFVEETPAQKEARQKLMEEVNAPDSTAVPNGTPVSDTEAAGAGLQGRDGSAQTPPPDALRGRGGAAGGRVDEASVHVGNPAAGDARASDVAGTSSVKEPWHMTRDEFVNPPSAYSQMKAILGDTPYKAPGDYSGMSPEQATAIRDIEARYAADNKMWGRAAKQVREELTARFPDKAQRIEFAEVRRNGETHRLLVEKALGEGKPVRPKVLADYPDLVKKYEQPAAEPTVEPRAASVPPRLTDTAEALSLLDAPVPDPHAFRAQMKAHFNLSDEEADAVSAIADARANAWAKENGRTPEEYYRTRFAGITSGGEPTGDELNQAAHLREGFREPTPDERKALKIPPAWTEVAINSDPAGELVAVGRDAKGRTQRLYSADHASAALVAKFERQRAFNEALPGLMDRINRDSANGSEEAKVLRLIAQTGFRVGGEADTGGKVKAYGASTLRPEHVKIDGDTAHFDFTGKLGVRQQHSVRDAEIARDLGDRVALARDPLFRTSDARVRRYLHSIAGEQFKVHDFRTWNATEAARKAIEDMGVPKTPDEYWRARDEVGDIAARKIGDTRQIALDSYIDPHVFAEWREKAGLDENAQRPRRLSATGDVRSKTAANERPLRDNSLQQPALAQGNKAAVEFLSDGRAVIHAFEKADVSSAWHELAHVFRRDLSPELLKSAEESLRVKDGNWTREHDEQFARGFEWYLLTGDAPTYKLQKVFEAAKQWLTQIYGAIRGKDHPLSFKPNEKLIATFDRMLGGEGDQTAASQTSGLPAPKLTPQGEQNARAETTEVASKLTGAANATTEAERQSRGLDPIEKQAYSAVGASYLKGKEDVESGRVDPRSLAQAIDTRPRPLTSAEVGALAHDRAKLINEHAEVVKQVSDAVDRGDETAIAEGRQRLQRVESDLDANDRALQKGGREQSAAFNARRMLVADDYSFAGVLQRAKAAKGAELTPEERGRFEELTKRLDEANRKLADSEERNKQLQAEQSLKQMAREVRRATRSKTKASLDDEFAALKAQFAQARAKIKSTVQPSGLAGLDPEGELSSLILKMAKNRVRAGVVTAEDLVSELHSALKDHGLTPRDIRDALSGYGKTSEMNVDEAARRLRELKSQMRLASAIEDAESGQKPLRSGLQREKDSRDVQVMRRELRRKLSEQGLIERPGPALHPTATDLGPKQGPRMSQSRLEGPRLSEGVGRKEGPRLTEAPKQGPKDWLPGAKKRLQSQIDDLQSKIDRNNFTKAPKREALPLDREGQGLQIQRDRLKNQIKAEIRRAGQTRLQKVGNVAAALNRNALLSLRGLTRILSGMSAKQAADAVARVIETPVDAAVSRLRGTPRTAGGLTPAGAVRASLEGARDGARNALDAVRGRETQFTPADEPLTGIKILDASINSMTRLYSAKENLLRSYAYRESIQRQARIFALNDAKEGVINRGEVAERTKEYINNPPPLASLNSLIASEAARVQAEYEANKSAGRSESNFRDDLRALMDSVARSDADRAVYAERSRISERVNRATNALGAPGKVVRELYLPFMKRPSNSIVDFLQSYVGAPLNVPAQAVRMMARPFSAEAQSRFANSVGKGAVGYSLMGVGYALAARGMMKGGNLTVNGQSYDVSKVPFVGWLLGVGSTLHDKGVRGIPGTVAKEILAHPLLRGVQAAGDTVGNVARGVKDDKLGTTLAREAVRTGGQFASRLVPQPLPTIAEATDTKERVTNENMAQPALSRVPVLRQRTLRPYADKSPLSVVNPFYSQPPQPKKTGRASDTRSAGKGRR